MFEVASSAPGSALALVSSPTCSKTPRSMDLVKTVQRCISALGSPSRV